MSRKRTARPPARLAQKSIFGGFVQPRSDEAVQRDVMAAVDAGDYGHLPQEIVAGFTPEQLRMADFEIDGEFGWDSQTCSCSMTSSTFRKVVRSAMAAGFVTALVKYRKELAGVPALARFYSRGETGRRKSRENQTARKQTRASVAKSLAKAGHTVAEIVTHFRANGMPTCDRSTVYRWLKVKSRAR